MLLGESTTKLTAFRVVMCDGGPEPSLILFRRQKQASHTALINRLIALQLVEPGLNQFVVVINVAAQVDQKLQQQLRWRVKKLSSESRSRSQLPLRSVAGALCSSRAAI